MATGQVVRASVYIDSHKVVEIESSDLASKTNGERMHGAEGVVGISNGNQEVDVRCNIVGLKQPGGAVGKLHDAHNSQADVDVFYKFGGKSYQMACKITELSLNGDNRSGVARGSFTLMNAEPPKQV